MTIPGVPEGGFRTVGQTVPTNQIRFGLGQDAQTIAAELVEAHVTGGPVVDERNRFVGFVSEIDLLKALLAGNDLAQLKAEHIMTPIPVSVDTTTPISEAVRIMDQCHLLNLPVEENGEVRYSITRHDLLRACLGLGLSREDASTAA